MKMFYAAAVLAVTAPIAAITPAAAQHEGHEAALTTELPIETLMANDAAKAVVLAHIPGMDQHPAYDQFKAISLRALAPYSQGTFDEATLDRIDADLAAL